MLQYSVTRGFTSMAYRRMTAASRLSSEQVRLQPMLGYSSFPNFNHFQAGFINFPGESEPVASSFTNLSFLSLDYLKSPLISSDLPQSELLDWSSLSLAFLLNSFRQQGSKLSSMRRRVLPLMPMLLLEEGPPRLGTMSIIQQPYNSRSTRCSCQSVARMCVRFFIGEQYVPLPQKTPAIISPWYTSPFSKSIRPQSSRVPSKKFPAQISFSVRMTPRPQGLRSQSMKPRQAEFPLPSTSSMTANYVKRSRFTMYLLSRLRSSSDCRKDGGSTRDPFSTCVMASSLPSYAHLADTHMPSDPSKVSFSPSRCPSKKSRHFTNFCLYVAIAHPLNLPCMNCASTLQPSDVQMMALPQRRSCCQVPMITVPLRSIITPSPCFICCFTKPWQRKASLRSISSVAAEDYYAVSMRCLCLWEYLVWRVDFDLLICWQVCGATVPRLMFWDLS